MQNKRLDGIFRLLPLKRTSDSQEGSYRLKFKRNNVISENIWKISLRRIAVWKGNCKIYVAFSMEKR